MVLYANTIRNGNQTIPNIPGSVAATLKESDEEEYARYMRPKSAEELGAKLMQPSFSEAPGEVWNSYDA